MPSHAEKNPIEIENYYHIIDPKRKLSEKRLWLLNQRYQSQRLVATETERLKVFLRKTWWLCVLPCTFLRGFHLNS